MPWAAQDFRGVGHAHPVGQHQIRPQQGLPEGLIVPGGQQELRIGGDRVVEAAALHQGGAGLSGLVQGQVVEADAQNICPQNDIASDWNSVHNLRPFYHILPKKSMKKPGKGGREK